MKNFAQVARAFLPPIITDAAVRWRRGRLQRAEGLKYVSTGWQEAAKYRGWNAESVRAAYAATWPRLVREAQTAHPLNVIMGSDDGVLHNMLLCFAYSLTLAARKKSFVSFLDWGGAIGQYYLLAQAILPGVTIDYNCKDVPLLAEYGQTLHPDSYFTSDESGLSRTYDFVLVSGSLQYSENWQEILTKLAHATSGYLLLTRTPVHEQGASYVFSQSAYGSEWLGWSLSRRDLLDCAAAAGLTIVREFTMSDADIPIVNAPHPSRQRGFLFRSRQ